MLVLKPNLLFKASKRKYCNLTVEREFKAQGYLIGWRSTFGEHIYRSSYINFLAEKKHLANLSELGNVYPAWSNSLGTWLYWHRLQDFWNSPILQNVSF